MTRLLALALIPALTAASIETRVDPAGAFVSVAGRDQFCTAHPDLCTAYGPDEIPDSANLRSWLASVNDTVNAAISYRSVQDSSWQIYPRAGDCNDFAVTKLALLLDAGLPRNALRLAVVQAGQPEIALNGDTFTFWRWHMVLTVQTTGGTLVLDSLRRDVSEWVPTSDRAWVALEESHGDQMAFTRLRSMTAAGFEEVK